jgi:hypothetical protein
MTKEEFIEKWQLNRKPKSRMTIWFLKELDELIESESKIFCSIECEKRKPCAMCYVEGGCRFNQTKED